VGYDREILRRDAVPLGAVAVATEGNTPSAGFPRAENDAAGDPRRQVLLENTSVDDLADQGCHAFPPTGLPPGWSAGLTIYPRPVALSIPRRVNQAATPPGCRRPPRQASTRTRQPRGSPGRKRRAISL